MVRGIWGGKFYYTAKTPSACLISLPLICHPVYNINYLLGPLLVTVAVVVVRLIGVGLFAIVAVLLTGRRESLILLLIVLVVQSVFSNRLPGGILLCNPLVSAGIYVNSLLEVGLNH